MQRFKNTRAPARDAPTMRRLPSPFFGGTWFKVVTANLLWFLYSAYMSRKWKRASRDVVGRQLAVLKRIVSHNVDSEFGHEYHFAEIDSVEAYQHSVPIRSYEGFQPYIERISEGHPKVLTSER